MQVTIVHQIAENPGMIRIHDWILVPVRRDNAKREIPEVLQSTMLTLMNAEQDSTTPEDRRPGLIVHPG